MSKHLDREMDRLRDRLIDQFGIVEEMTHMAVRSLVQRQVHLADAVVNRDAEVDAEDIRIEEQCLMVLALHQPVAGDMRKLISVIKANAELERMADLACNVAERARALDLYPLFPVPDEMTDLSVATTAMVRRALDSFVDSDTTVAGEVLRADDEVDALNRIVIDQIHEIMKADSDQIEPGVHCFSASRHLERIADLAVSIAEDVIYSVDGDIIRHQHGTRTEPQAT